MLALNGNAKIFVCLKPVDLRKGFEGLGGVVQAVFNQELTGNAYFVFLNRFRDRMKVLYRDGDGFAIWYKRLEKGRFGKVHSEEHLIDRRSFLMMLEGVTPKRLQKRFKIS